MFIRLTNRAIQGSSKMLSHRKTIDYQSLGVSLGTSCPRVVTWRVTAPVRTLHALVVLVIVVSILPLSGCHRGTAHEEAEHHTPEHKPANYPAAIEQLLGLHREIMNGHPTRSADQIDVFSELFDVIRWLPELAADSDVTKEPWDRIHHTVKQFELDLEEVRLVAADKRHDAYRSREVVIDSNLRELVELKKHFPQEDEGL